MDSWTEYKPRTDRDYWMWSNDQIDEWVSVWLLGTNLGASGGGFATSVDRAIGAAYHFGEKRNLGQYKPTLEIKMYSHDECYSAVSNACKGGSPIEGVYATMNGDCPVETIARAICLSIIDCAYELKFEKEK